MKLFIAFKRGLRFAGSQRAGINQHTVRRAGFEKKGPGNRRPLVSVRNTLLHECCRPKGGLVSIGLNCCKVVRLYR
jgi:hypothetical protein